jgi:chromosome partitioning protein
MAMVLSATAQKGGSGKSTVITNLAAYWANQGEMVVIIDLDAQGSSRVWAEIREESRPDAPEVDVVCLEDLEELGVGHEAIDFVGIAERARGRWDRVLIDVHGRDSAIMDSAMHAADVAIMPVKAGGFDELAAPNTVEALEEAVEYKAARGEPFMPILLLNFARAREVIVRESRRMYSEELDDFEVLSEYLHFRNDYSKAATRGLGVVEYKPKGAAAREIRRLAQLIDETAGAGLGQGRAAAS